jgi:choice-of-anchor B domain-containing protein
MKKLLLFVSIILFHFIANGQQAYKMKLLSNYNDTLLPKVDVTDIWNDLTGWFDPIKNREYIIAGTTDSVYFFDITIPTQIKLVARQHGSSRFARNRDYETYKHYAYCVSDQASGIGALQIFDLQYLPDSVHKVYESNALGTFTHTIFVDSQSKRLYMSMNSKPGGFSALDVLSLENPENPLFLAELQVPKDPNNFDLFNAVHEMYVRNDTVYLSCENAGLFIFDLKNLSNQRLINIINSYPDRGYNHSSWLDKTGRYIMFTDENTGLDIKIYDLKNFTEPRFVSMFNSNSSAMPHNAFWYGDFAYVSSYHDGVRVYNVKDPSKPYQVAWYDTHPVEPEQYGGFKGCWGIYPFLPSKHIIASDLTSGIFVFEIDSSLVGNENIISNNLDFGFFPNPTHDNIFISGLENGIYDFTLFNISGIQELHGTLGSNRNQIDLSHLAAGVYFLNVFNEKGNQTKKIIKW